jgi:FKBP-type peptidyl-prolyl cis-trans isomerase
MSRAIRLALLAAAVALPVRAAAVSLESEDEQLAYLMGALTGQRLNLIALGLTDSELEALGQGLMDAAANRQLAVSPTDVAPKLREFQQRRKAEVLEAELGASAAFLEETARKEGVVKDLSGYLYEEVVEGTGQSPGPDDTVRVHYTGTLRDGRTFDSSVLRGLPAEFKVSGVIKCWTEGLRTMKVGGKRRLFCPASTAYGERGQPPMIKPGAALVFDVELLAIVK